MGKRKVNLGKIGEQRAAEYLRKQKYKILARNFHSRGGEIDIIAQDDDFLVLVEVKTRWSKNYGQPEEAVDSQKIDSIVKTGQYYRLLHPKTSDLIRLDVVAIELDSSGKLKELRHLKNVTG